MDRPSRHEVLMRHAMVAALRSTCSRAQVGAVIARDGRILVTGYNGAPAGMPHCDHTCDCGGPQDYTDSYGTEYKGVHDDECNTTLPCTIAVHDVANAIAYAARHGIKVEGADLYTTLTPCVNCAMLLINSGIGQVYAAEAYRDPAGVELLETAGVTVHTDIETGI